MWTSHPLSNSATGPDGLPLHTQQAPGSGLFGSEEEIRERTFAEARHFRLLAGVRTANPLVQKEVAWLTTDLMPVQSF